MSTPAGYEQLAVSSSAVSLASVPDKSNLAVVYCGGGAVRFRDDGTDPTASVGNVLDVGERLEYDNRADKLRFIRRDSTDATLDVYYSK